MEDFYNILAKHFRKETSGDEEAHVKLFMKENPEEYNILRKLWGREDIVVKDYDVQKAWDKLLLKYENQRQTKVISILPRLRRIAAIAAILIIGAVSTLYFINRSSLSDDVIVTTDKEKLPDEIILSDGSSVWLNGNSTLTYPREFSDSVRKLELRGEAFFTVRKNTHKPFVVSTIHSDVRVLGTSFNINTVHEQTQVSVQTGKVAVNSNKTGDEVILTDDLTAVVTDDFIVSRQIENPNFLVWKTGSFVFDNTPIQQVISDLNTYYSKQLILDPESKLSCQLKAKFDRVKFEEVLEILQITCNIKIEQKNNVYVIH